MLDVLNGIPKTKRTEMVEKWLEIQEEYSSLNDDEKIKRSVDIQVKNFNEIKSDIQLNFFCEKCKNKGQVAYADFDDFSNEYKFFIKDCECMPKRRIYFNMKSSGFVSGDTKYTFKNFNIENDFTKNIFEKAKNNLDSDSWFFIGGQVGCGKTHICTAISIELLKRGYRLKMVSWRDLMSDIKNGFSGKPTRFDFEKYKKTEMLFIDDFLHGDATEFELEKAFEIIDFRYRNNLKTIISSELLLGEILNLMQSTGSRIVERANNFICDIKRDTSKNYRLLKK